MKIMLTVRKVATLKGGSARVEYLDSVIDGLALRVTPAGHKSWSVRYRTRGGRRRRLKLGTYPGLSLGDARLEAGKAIRDAQIGADPKAAREAAKQGETFDDLKREYILRHAKVHKKSWRADERMLKAEVLPHWKSRKVRELTRRDVRELLDRIVTRGSPVTADRCLALVRKMLNFAIARDWIEANVASLMTKAVGERRRERVLHDDEIRLVWQACETQTPALRTLMRLRLLTAQRGGELAQLKWSDIEGDWLTLPATVTKNGVAHRVPLSVLAKRELDAMPRRSKEWVFAGRFDLSPVEAAKRVGGWVAAAALEQLQRTDPSIRTFDFRGHDLRRTAATLMAAAGVPNVDIAKVLNHVDRGPRATQIYNRYEYDREKKIALDTLARVVGPILDDTMPESRVVPFSQSR